MLSSKVFLFFLAYVLTDIVTCGRVFHLSEKGENENIQYQQVAGGENQNHVPSILENRLNKIHNVKRRSPFLTSLKHVVGHVVGHVREHLGFHRPNPDYEDRHFHPHHEYPLHHQHNSHPGHNFPNDFSIYQDSQEYFGHPPRFPDREIPETEEHRYDFPQYNPGPSFHHHEVSNDKNDHHHGFHSEDPNQRHGVPDEENKHPTTTLDQTTNRNKPVVYPPFEEDQNNKNNNHYPVSDFDRKKDGKNGDKPKPEEGRVDIESDFPGSAAGNTKNDGSTPPDWVNPDDDVENMESGEIPPTSKIDIRFRKN